ncbi:MAG: DUF1501 domain-containing protein, partial [Planctomycetales bacterium]|nr:DUF1501 domain-containing protein [Planctomycetales bacterium]
MNGDRSSHSCGSYQQWNRRRYLAGMSAAALSGLWLTRFAERLARAAEAKPSEHPKSLLILWLQGGPSQLETFDPHPGTTIGGEVRGISTSIPGVQIADTLPATAEQLRHTTLIRSLVSKEGDHERATYHLKTGWRPDPTLVHPAIGSIVCHQSPNNIEIPRHISVLPTQWPARGGYLGPSYDAFQIGDPLAPIPNLTPRVPAETMATRRGLLLETVETEFQRGRLPQLNRQRTLHQTATERAFQMMDSPQLAAFDVQAEGTQTLARFGHTPFGRGCLAAIRLLSAGVRCVEVELDGWDSHINNHALQAGQAKILDSALAATLQELHARDLLEHTIVLCGGEFGRTPRINAAGGRDHWPQGFSALLAGGAFRRGYVHGATVAQPDPQQLERAKRDPQDRQQWVTQPVSVPDLNATMLQA